MVSFAAGCSAGGIYPIVQTIIPFLVERAFEQIKLDFCAQGNPGLIVGVGGGLEYSKLGYTHQTIWDTSLLANLEGLELFTPTVGAAEVSELLPPMIRSRSLVYARLTDCYLKDDYAGPYARGQLFRLRAGTDKSRARVVCGAFPGIQGLVEDAGCDVYAYSFPNLVPSNVAVLSAYSQIEVWEFATTSMLGDRLKKALPDKRIRRLQQQARFFREYGSDAAARFIASNWTEVT